MPNFGHPSPPTSPSAWASPSLWEREVHYPGDKKVGDFKQRWLEIIAGIKPESVPQEEELRDALCRKLKGNSKSCIHTAY